MKTSIGFSIYINGKFDRKIDFDRPIINVGKLSTSNMRLDDINVSRKHAVIEQLETGAWRVTDLGSTNGTVLHGERVVQAEVKDGDRITLGTTTLLVHLNVATATASAPQGQTQAASGPETKASAAGNTAGKGGRSTTPAMSSQPEEIRGLGEESFYKKKQQNQKKGERLALEVALLWGDTILTTRTFMKAENIIIGEQREAHFALPEEQLGRRSFKLVANQAGKFALNLDRCGLEGDVLLGDKVQSLEELRQSPQTKNKLFPIDQPMRARLKTGEFTMLVSYGPVPAKPIGPRLHESDHIIIACISVVALVHLAFLALLAWMPEDLRMSNRDPRLRKERAMQVMRVELPEEKKEEKPEVDEEDPNAKKRYSKDAKADKLKVSATEVKVESPVNRRLKLVDKLNQKKRQDREDLAQLSDEDRAKKVKDLAQMTAMNEAFNGADSALKDLLNPDIDSKNKTNPFRVLASKGGSAPAAAASASVDPFGGSLPTSTGGFQGVGGPSQTGPSGGPAIAGALGKRPGGHRLGDIGIDKRTVEPKIIQLQPRLVGALDAKTVQNYIRRHLSGIKWCYQERLQQNRRLKGKLTLAFTIFPNGKVYDAHTKNSSVKDQVLEACIVKKMSRWRFPQPKDGGVVEVGYPLILKTQ